MSYRPALPVAKLKTGTRVSLDMTTLTIMRILPREVDPMVYKMSLEDPGGATFAGIGGLGEQVRELREVRPCSISCCSFVPTEVYYQVIELPLLNPELFKRVGINPPKGVLLYGPPGTGKTLLARAVAATLNTNFLKVVSSAIVDKYIGESARVIREMFGYARDHEPCVIFMDEIDAIGGRRFSEGTSADREIQRTLMEVRILHMSLRNGPYHYLADSCAASEPDGWVRFPRPDEAYHGDKSTRHIGPCSAAPWPTRPQNRDSSAE